MLSKLLGKLAGRDDVEQIAHLGDPAALDAYLQTRKLLVPKKPNHFLDADTFTKEELLELTQAEAKELAGKNIELWVLEVEGTKRLPAFSSMRRLHTFSAKMSKELNKVFSLGYVEMFLPSIRAQIDIDYVDLNLFSSQSWEIGMKNRDEHP